MFNQLDTHWKKDLLIHDSQDKALLIAETAFSKKARNILILKLEELTIVSDFFVICTADSPPQIKAIVDSIEERLGANGFKPQGIDGQPHDRWVVIDYGDVIFHVFDEEKRGYYELEKLWLDAPRIPVTFIER